MWLLHLKEVSGVTELRRSILYLSCYFFSLCKSILYIKNFSDKQKLKELMNIKPELHVT
jgi:hypothetical protein